MTSEHSKYQIGPVSLPMLKLYKRGRGGVRYWEAWAHGAWIIVHEGKLGERGKVKHLFPEDGRTPEQVIAEAAQKPRQRGYAEIPMEQHHQVVVQYRLKTWASAEDLEKGYNIEELFNECLGWTGNGCCDGNDIGSGTLNIFSDVVDPQIGAETIIATLRKHRLLKGAVVAVREDDEYRVAYPSRFKGDFSL
jgi:predicted DNA-binding WGR domain protein